MNLHLSRRLGLLLLKAAKLRESDVFSELEDLDYLKEIEARLKQALDNLSSQGEVAEGPVDLLEEHRNRVLSLIQEFDTTQSVFVKLTDTPSLPMKKSLIYKLKEQFYEEWEALAGQFEKVEKNFNRDDWNSKNEICPILLKYDELKPSGNNRLCCSSQLKEYVNNPEGFSDSWVSKINDAQNWWESTASLALEAESSLIVAQKNWEMGHPLPSNHQLWSFPDIGVDLKKAIINSQKLQKDLKDFFKWIPKGPNAQRGKSRELYFGKLKKLESIRSRSVDLPEPVQKELQFEMCERGLSAWKRELDKMEGEKQRNSDRFFKVLSISIPTLIAVVSVITLTINYCTSDSREALHLHKDLYEEDDEVEEAKALAEQIGMLFDYRIILDAPLLRPSTEKADAHFLENYSGWAQETYVSGEIKSLSEYAYGKLISAVVWKPDGEKCPVTKFKDGNGVVVEYNEDGTEKNRYTYRDGEPVED